MHNILTRMELPEHWQRTPENINALPEPVRRYIMHLETLCDPPGLVRENVLLKEQIAGLMKKLTDS
jgi:hypothetical protein